MIHEDRSPERVNCVLNPHKPLLPHTPLFIIQSGPGSIRPNTQFLVSVRKLEGQTDWLLQNM